MRAFTEQPRSATGSTVEIFDERGRVVRRLMFDVPAGALEDAADPVIADPAAASSPIAVAT
jgi:hypothetical protein